MVINLISEASSHKKEKHILPALKHSDVHRSRAVKGIASEGGVAPHKEGVVVGNG